MKTLFIALLFLFPTSCNLLLAQSQDTNQKRSVTEFAFRKKKIDQIEISDSFLIKKTKEFINYRIAIDTAFAFSGYIELYIEGLSDKPGSSPALCYYIHPSYSYINLNNYNWIYPLFYFTLNRKLVLVYDRRYNNDGLTKKNKKKLVKLVNKQLARPEYHIIITPEGKKMKLGPVVPIMLHQGKRFCE